MTISGITHEKCIQISTDTLGIGSVIHEIDVNISEILSFCLRVLTVMLTN